MSGSGLSRASHPLRIAAATVITGAIALATVITGAIALILAGPSAAASGFYIRGGGNGHGIGMSQYGSYGYALHGKKYRWILAHYYQGTSIGTVRPSRTVRVLRCSLLDPVVAFDRQGDRRAHDPGAATDASTRRRAASGRLRSSSSGVAGGAPWLVRKSGGPADSARRCRPGEPAESSTPGSTAPP